MHKPVPYLSEIEAPTRAEVDSLPGLILLEFDTGWCSNCRYSTHLRTVWAGKNGPKRLFHRAEAKHVALCVFTQGYPAELSDGKFRPNHLSTCSDNAQLLLRAVS